MTIHLLEITVGRPSEAPKLVKQAVRFGRRLREHGIHNYEFPSLVDDARYVCKVTVGRRMVNIFDDGSLTPSLLKPEIWPFPQGRLDPTALAAQSNRMHALYLEMAAHARRSRRKDSARANLNTAIQERLSNERTCRTA
jgi:hypothetical protein